MVSVAIVPGHGGGNRGTQQGGIDEADYVLRFGHELSASVRGALPGANPFLVRPHDEEIPLSEGARRAEAAGCGLALVIHCNAGPASLSGGLAFSSVDPDGVAERVGQRILDAYPRELRPKRRDPIPVYDQFGVTKIWLTAARNVLAPYKDRGIPAVLVELFYSTAPQDVAFGVSKWGRKQLQLACLFGIARWALEHDSTA